MLENTFEFVRVEWYSIGTESTILFLVNLSGVTDSLHVLSGTDGTHYRSSGHVLR